MPARGCGDERVQGGLYMVVPMSANGLPIEAFLVDPAVPYLGRQARAPQLFSIPGSETKHVLIGMGASFYPFVPDAVEEIRVLGLSKRVPASINLKGLVPGESRLLIEHPKAIPEFDYTVHAYGQKIAKGSKDNPGCAKDIAKEHLCLSDTYPLSADPMFSSEKHEVSVVPLENIRRIKTPSTTYTVFMDDVEMTPPIEYQAGIILRFPFFQFEFVSKSGAVPRKIAEKFESSEFDFNVVPE